MPSNKLNVLITRPQQQGLILAKQLQALNFGAQCQPLFHYQSDASSQDLQSIQQKTHQPILIFISVAAVEFAHQVLPLSQWSQSLVVSIGSATQEALTQLNIPAICPLVHTSEGLLDLEELSHVNGQDVVIVKGDAGRELIAHTLQNRGANVHHINCYQRVWYQLDTSQIEQWRNLAINCIVVTSNALLERIVHLIQETIHDTDDYWQSQCLWVVASERIAERAQQLGLQKIVNAHGATDKHIVNALFNNGIA